VAGLRVVYRILDGNKGHRIESIKTPCDGIKWSNVEITHEHDKDGKQTAIYNEEQWCDVLDDKKYVIGMVSFLANGKKKIFKNLFSGQPK